jgi:nitrate reductase alpha subunit
MGIFYLKGSVTGVKFTLMVGGLEHEFYDFPYIGNVIIPTDEHIFQRG